MRQNRGNDPCVCCGCDTGVPRDMPIDAREHYILGAGQLCKRCFFELYIRKTEDACTVQEDEMNTLIRLCKSAVNTEKKR